MSRRARKSGGRQLELIVKEVGGHGDGVAYTVQGQPVFIPLTLPGERVLTRLVAEKTIGHESQLIELLEASQERREPPCPHFGPCGGCQLQHWQENSYHAWKQERIAKALMRAGFTTSRLEPLFIVPLHSRRRACFALERKEDGQVIVGFRGRASDRLSSIPHCVILVPELIALLEPLCELGGNLLAPKQSARVHVNLSDTGVDLLLHLPFEPERTEHIEAVSDFARMYDLARVTWNKNILLVKREPRVALDKSFTVPLPPGGFMQATQESFDAMRAVLESVLPPQINRAADLYCGVGVFTFSLLKRAKQVLAADADQEAIKALERSAKGAALSPKLTLFCQKLDTRPLHRSQLQDLDFVILDPPRAGAQKQMAELVAAKPKHIFYISCNPITFARDSKLLYGAGYRLEKAAGFDQFLYAAHIELVAFFTRDNNH